MIPGGIMSQELNSVTREWLKKELRPVVNKYVTATKEFFAGGCRNDDLKYMTKAFDAVMASFDSVPGRTRRTLLEELLLEAYSGEK
jgi:hypothetical protein